MLGFKRGKDKSLWRKDSVKGDDFSFEFHDICQNVFSGGFGKNGALNLLRFFGEDV